MKKLFTLIFLLPLLVFGQLTMNDIGLPDALSPMQNVVITSSRINNITVSGGRVVTKSTTPGFTAYALNYIQAKIHEESFRYVGEVSGVQYFQKDPITFSVNGTTYNIDGQTMTIARDLSNKWTIRLIPQTSSYRLLVSRKWVTYTADELAALAGITKEQLWGRDADVYNAEERNPQTHITSVFVKVAKAGTGYTAQTYVNLMPATSYGNKITSYNKSGVGYIVRWKLYNGCTAANAISGGYEKGNFGLCEMRGPLPSGSENTAQTFAYDTSREYVTIECQLEELPAQGKNFSTSGYYVVQGCDIDDPCGPALRLPRKPVQ